MRVSSASAFRFAAIVGLLGVALGAFGAHGLKEVLARREHAAEWWEKAVFYHFIHAVVLLVLALLQPFPRAASCWFTAGILAFSGSLYLLALTGAHWLVFLTPLGGFCLLGGWLCLVFYPSKAQVD
jgi:uncharacterized membrane protein YgdD (TMEM256/DUF423 family)